ncbi:MAG TPA: DUF2293 domain-containing protein [Blastocatellia bacterium]|nr:DUF2293 domain-containing protein [Blastocatellia bacterium]
MRHALIRLVEEPPGSARRALCLECADLAHLEFLPRGSAAVTRRAAKHSRLWAVVVEWSRTRKQYERQGILAEPEAIDQALAECEADADVRAARREKEAERRAMLDQNYVAEFARAIKDQFPAIPAGAELRIAEHACVKHSGRVGRSSAAKAFSPEAILLAVQAHVRHVHTNYDELLFEFDDRAFARSEVRNEVERVLAEWRGETD